MNLFEINFRTSPFRGTLTEVAKAKKVSVFSVSIGLRRKNPEYVKAVKDEVIKRLKEVDGEIDLDDLKEAV